MKTLEDYYKKNGYHLGLWRDPFSKQFTEEDVKEDENYVDDTQNETIKQKNNTDKSI